ncbi:PREDICTED: butyrophilin subfamily 3 member A2-like isoform X7 [Corvus brachyrhynchos]|uniref:butyrophilin subfamily 3 member A2-like isoform X7 n=1 Tax=Corvus brachyrhynchos TaxID=85066 RepID=UPI0008165E7E|nr:PREDICTED: butyrophilin subfamily 3 member A2-like isoform X7 [Corvus brachyrhynchos]
MAPVGAGPASGHPCLRTFQSHGSPDWSWNCRAGKQSSSCTISSTKPLDNPQVHWIKITDGHTEDIYTYGHFGGEPMQKYRGRTSVPGDGFATGNVSLTLKNVLPADEGRYICSVESSVWFAENDTKLSVAGTGEVFIDVLGYQEKGLELGCRSQGWFPKPTVQWVNEDGQGLSADTEIHQDSRSLFSVWSRVTVTGEQVGKVTCQILNPLLQVEKKTTLSLSGDVFPRVSPGLPAFWTVFTLFLLTLAAAAVLVYRAMLLCSTVLDKRKTEEANTSQALESRLEKDLKQLSQQIQTLIQAFQNMQESTEHDLMIRTDLENKRGMTEEGNATMILESTWQKDLQQISHQLQNLQQILHNMQMSTQRDLQLLRTELENKRELSKVESYKGKHRGDDGGETSEPEYSSEKQRAQRAVWRRTHSGKGGLMTFFTAMCCPRPCLCLSGALSAVGSRHSQLAWPLQPRLPLLLWPLGALRKSLWT